MINELDTVMLTEDLPKHDLGRSDLGTVVQSMQQGAMRLRS